jgi:putative ABC transport system permease protein
MIKNYFKTAWRNLIRNKAFSVINLSGLALGIACSVLIFLWVWDERHIDAFHANRNYLYQVYERNFYDGKVEADYPTQGLLAVELKRTIPEVQYASGYEHASAPGTQSTFEANGKINKMDGAFTGEDFFKMFSYPLLQGQPQTALTSNESIAISRKMAESFFGSAAEAIGKTIRYENKEDLLITAVFENIPAASSLQFDFCRSWVAYVKQNDWVHNWGNTSPATFIQLRKDADPEKVQSKIKDFIYHYQSKDPSFATQLALQRYTDRHLYSTFKEGKIDGGRIEYVRMFTMVAIFILLIACINFMNLATARSAIRAREVGVRKVVGAMRSMLIRQFIGEAVLLTLFSAIIALVLVFICLPVFNELTRKQLSLPVSQPVFWMALLLLVIVTGFIAGSYPALFLSAINPVKVLKSSLKFGRGAVFFRKTLVVFQFTLSVILIVGMIIIYQQVNYIQSKNLGYDRENLVYVPIEGDLANKYGVFKQEARKLPGVLSISKMRNSPTVIEHHTGSISWEGKEPNLSVSFADAVVGYDFTQTMKLALKEGRDFSKDYGTDSVSFLLNETAVAKIGYKNPVGRTITWGSHKGVIIGVLQDFHFSSMHQAIDPLIVRLDDNWTWGTILVRIKGDKTRDALTGLKKLCSELNPKFPFAYSFSDEEYARLYRGEQIISKLSNYFAFLAIFISCLGLFGLATFSASQRTKEIGVRKVLGATVSNIVSLLAVNFLKPVFIAILLATPVSQYLMSRWLGSFAYKIEMKWWMFVAAGVLAVLIALLTISYQAVKAAISNPVKNLRAE